jgi:predicted O-methyltransferase YrrM
MNEGAQQFPFSDWDEMGGWCVPQIVEVLQPLHAFQRIASQKTGPVAEIGVYHGKFFLLLAAIKQDSNQKHLAVDVFDMQEFNLDGAGEGNLAVFTQNIKKFELNNSVEIETADSLHLHESIIRKNEEKFDFFSIDGCHTKLHTINDIRKAERMISSLGILFVDDYTNSSWPGVQEGVAAYLSGNHGNLVPLAVTSNKLIMCSASMHKIYLDFLSEYLNKFCTAQFSEIEISHPYKTLSLSPDYSKSLSEVWKLKDTVESEVDACRVQFLEKAQSSQKVLSDVLDSEISFNSTNSEEEKHEIQLYLAKSSRFLEFGSGYSTMLASKNVRKSIVSVETDLAYIESIRIELSASAEKLPMIELIHADVGAVGAWGTPIDRSNVEKWTNYQIAVLNFAHENNWRPDLILIDGRFRIATFMSVYLSFPGAIIIFDDYVDRPAYHIVEKILQPSKIFGRVAVFKIPRWRSRKNIARATILLSSNILNPI